MPSERPFWKGGTNRESVEEEKKVVDVFHDDPRGEVIFVTTGLENRNVKFVKLEFEFVDWSTYGRGEYILPRHRLY